MANFSYPWTNRPEKMNKVEILSALRFALAAELEAINVYQQIAESSQLTYVREAMRSIAKEEMLHVGEILRLIAEVEDTELEKYREGMAEVEKIIKTNRIFAKEK